MMAVDLRAPVAEDASLCPAADPFSLADANINPITGLSTDYLNHFNEAIMLLEMLPVMPECRDDLAAWRPLSYHEHFGASHLRQRELTMAAYDLADPLIRRPFDALCETMNAMVLAACAALQPDLPPDVAATIAEQAAADLKPLIARASALIHGFDRDGGDSDQLAESQALVDAILTP